jgi:hypothetical protein
VIQGVIGSRVERGQPGARDLSPTPGARTCAASAHSTVLNVGCMHNMRTSTALLFGACSADVYIHQSTS